MRISRRKQYFKKHKKKYTFIYSTRFIYKSLFILLLTFIFYKLNITKNNSLPPIQINTSNTINIQKANDNYVYFSCFIAMGKAENLHARELIEHYISIGFEKFYLGDDNSPNSEQLSDVLQDYIDKGYVDIIDVRGKNLTLTDYYQYSLEKYKHKCKWMSFYDFDEYLEFVDKNMTIKDYLSLDIFNKCDVIKIHWLMVFDNGLIHYDNRTLKERFPKPDYSTFMNHFHKSIVRGRNYNGTMWTKATGVHQPNETLVYGCNEIGNRVYDTHGILTSPIYKYGYIKHYSWKTIEEFGQKLLRGFDHGGKYDINSKVEAFFKYNKFTKEKLEIIENILNTTFPKFHLKENDNDIKILLN